MKWGVIVFLYTSLVHPINQLSLKALNDKYKWMYFAHNYPYLHSNLGSKTKLNDIILIK